MKITKRRLKEIIKEELNGLGAPGLGKDVRFTTVEGAREDMTMPAISMDDMEAAMATDDEKFTGGTPEEQMLTRIKARDLLAAMSKEELKELSLSLDAETVAELRHLLTNPMYGSSLEEGSGQGDRAYQQATQLLGKFAQMHELRNNVADALRAGKVTPQKVRDTVAVASSSYHVAQQLGLGE
jgi:hypothetical protein